MLISDLIDAAHFKSNGIVRIWDQRTIDLICLRIQKIRRINFPDCSTVQTSDRHCRIWRRFQSIVKLACPHSGRCKTTLWNGNSFCRPCHNFCIIILCSCHFVASLLQCISYTDVFPWRIQQIIAMSSAIILSGSITVVQGITDTSNDVCAENAAHKQIFSGTALALCIVFIA